MDATGVDDTADDDGFALVAQVAPGAYGDLEPTTAPLVDDHGRVRLSYSRVDTFEHCPLAFRYRYVDRLPPRPAPARSFGGSVHAVLERLYDRKLPDWPTERELLAWLYELWDSSGFAGRSREEQLRYYRLAQDALRRWYRAARPRMRLALGVEVRFELPIGERAVVAGAIDRIDVDDEGAFHLVDYKTARRTPTRTQVAGSLQLALYALACRHLYGRLPATVGLDCIVAGVEVAVPLEELALDRARERVLQVADAVLAGAYVPEPGPVCGWCDFRRLCPAWDDRDPAALGPAVTELRRLRRRVERDVRALRELEAGVVRAREELATRDPDGEAHEGR